MSTFKFLWIDDQKKKVETYREAIEDGLAHLKLKSTIELLEVKQNFFETLMQWVQDVKDKKAKPPNLFIIDHVFNPVLPFGIKGATVAHLLRREFPTVPMICVTSATQEKQPQNLDQGDLAEYSAIFSYIYLEQRLEELYVIAKDFPKLARPKAEPTVSNHIVDLLKAPASDKSTLGRILPEEFYYAWDATTEHRIARWILRTFLVRPGLLYDRLHAATLLGLTVPGFEKVEGLFDKARYKGAFATDSNPKWWVSTLRSQLFELVGDDGPDITQLAGRVLPGLVQADFSKCAASRSVDPPPDVVVQSDAGLHAEPKVVRHEFSAQHPNDTGTLPGFETQLVLVKRKK